MTHNSPIKSYIKYTGLFGDEASSFESLADRYCLIIYGMSYVGSKCSVNRVWSKIVNNYIRKNE